MPRLVTVREICQSPKITDPTGFSSSCTIPSHQSLLLSLTHLLISVKKIYRFRAPDCVILFVCRGRRVLLRRQYVRSTRNRIHFWESSPPSSPCPLQLHCHRYKHEECVRFGAEPRGPHLLGRCICAVLALLLVFLSTRMKMCVRVCLCRCV